MPKVEVNVKPDSIYSKTKSTAIKLQSKTWGKIN